ncbi:hypothetical protein, partial [Actinocorallia lasiicapitis]
MPHAEPHTDLSGARWGRAGLTCWALSLLGFGRLAAAGPSVVQPSLPGTGAPWSFHVEQSAGLAITIMALSLVLAGAGLGCCL